MTYTDTASEGSIRYIAGSKRTSKLPSTSFVIVVLAFSFLPISRALAQSGTDRAWSTLQAGIAEKDTVRRAGAVRVLGLIEGDPKAAELALNALKDEAPEVRASAIEALADMKAKSAVPRIQEVTKTDKEVSVVMAGGLDRHTLGLEGWRRRVASAPQFHENHIIVGTFAFNLLMARQWPPTKDDVALLEPLCAELGLDALLKRMPGGLMQMVGESGWQLSHGEKSRVFLARALLQDADLVILDESFAALDPENLKRSLECVKKRAKSLLVIAHR